MDNNSFYKSNIPKPIITLNEFLMMGNPMLLYNECQKYIEIFKEFDKDLKKIRRSNK